MSEPEGETNAREHNSSGAGAAGGCYCLVGSGPNHLTWCGIMVTGRLGCALASAPLPRMRFREAEQAQLERR